MHLLQTHGPHMGKHRSEFMRAFRAMHKTVQTKYDELKNVFDDNKYALDFIENQSLLMLGSHNDLNVAGEDCARVPGSS
jgi:hypothetical protein